MKSLNWVILWSSSLLALTVFITWKWWIDLSIRIYIQNHRFKTSAVKPVHHIPRVSADPRNIMHWFYEQACLNLWATHLWHKACKFWRFYPKNLQCNCKLFLIWLKMIRIRGIVFTLRTWSQIISGITCHHILGKWIWNKSYFFNTKNFTILFCTIQ